MPVDDDRDPGRRAAGRGRCRLPRRPAGSTRPAAVSACRDGSRCCAGRPGSGRSSSRTTARASSVTTARRCPRYRGWRPMAGSSMSARSARSCSRVCGRATWWCPTGTADRSSPRSRPAPGHLRRSKQRALALLLESGAFHRHIRRLRATYAARRDAFARGLADAGDALAIRRPRRRPDRGHPRRPLDRHSAGDGRVGVRHPGRAPVGQPTARGIRRLAGRLPEPPGRGDAGAGREGHRKGWSVPGPPTRESGLGGIPQPRGGAGRPAGCRPAR